MENAEPLSALQLLRNAGAAIKCNSFRNELAYNLVVDAVLYLEDYPQGFYYRPDRYASQLLGEKDDATEGAPAEAAVGGTRNLYQQEDRKAE